MNGSGVVQPVGEGAVGVLHDMPGGNQPPLQHVPPPSATNGSGVAHDVGLVGAGADVEVVDVEMVDVVAVVQTIPGGNQSPLQHVPPPRATNGSGVEHVLAVGVGAVRMVVDTSFEKPLVAPFTSYATTAKYQVPPASDATV